MNSQTLERHTETEPPVSELPVPSTPESDPRMVQALKALAHPIRLSIVQLLADKQAYGMQDDACCGSAEVCVCKITELFDVSMPTISHHLKLLREAGLVAARRDKVWIHYSLKREALDHLGEFLSAVARRGL